MIFLLVDLGPLGLYEEIYNARAPVHVTRARPTPQRIQIIWQNYVWGTFPTFVTRSDNIRVAEVADIEITQHQYFILFPKVY